MEIQFPLLNEFVAYLLNNDLESLLPQNLPDPWLDTMITMADMDDDASLAFMLFVVALLQTPKETKARIAEIRNQAPPVRGEVFSYFRLDISEDNLPELLGSLDIYRTRLELERFHREGRVKRVEQPTLDNVLAPDLNGTVSFYDPARERQELDVDHRLWDAPQTMSLQ